VTAAAPHPLSCGSLVAATGGNWGVIVSVSAKRYGVKLGNGEVNYYPRHLIREARRS
jgi:hypothetical protein